MKKKYEPPTIKVYVINADERIAAGCGGSIYTYQTWGCNDSRQDGMGEEACSTGGMHSS